MVTCFGIPKKLTQILVLESVVLEYMPEYVELGLELRMCRGWKNFEVHDRKVLHWILKVILLWAQKTVKSTVEKRFSILASTYIIVNRMSIETRMLKVLLMRSQKKTRNIFWKLEGKQSLLQSGRKLGWIVFYYWVEGRTYKQWTWILNWGDFSTILKV